MVHGTGWGPEAEPPEYWRELAIVWRNRAMMLFDHIPLPVGLCDPCGSILLANQAMAAEWGRLPGQLVGHNVLDHVHPKAHTALRPIMEAARHNRRSRYTVEVSWTVAGKTQRHGRLTVDLVSDDASDVPTLLLTLQPVDGPAEPPPATAKVSPLEARILALVAQGCTTAQTAREVGLTVDGVNYHITRLSRRWQAPNRTALIARAYVNGVLAPAVWPPEPA